MHTMNYRTEDWALSARRKYFEIATTCDAIGGRHQAVRERLGNAMRALRQAEQHLADLERHHNALHGGDASAKRAVELQAAEVRALSATHQQLAEQLAAVDAEAQGPNRLRSEARKVLLVLQVLNPSEA